ncbi:MAG: S-layer homology domain-containing protein [Cellulosilyticum sp.]|nr:S-layer homology domain-containing protein [Cellulosilyticum sp.]
MSKILNKRIVVTLLTPVVAVSAIPVNTVAQENQMGVASTTVAETPNFEITTDEQVTGVATIGDQVYETISEAIEEAKDGDTIIISSGTYSEPIVLDSKSIKLEGTGEHETTLTGGITFKDEAYDGSNITIRNLNIEQNGIYCNIEGNLGSTESLTIEDNIFRNIPSHARVYSVCIENTKNPISGLKIVNNEFTFDNIESSKEYVAGGINASVYGDAEITGNTFNNMPYNAILLYGVDNGSEHTVKVTGNTFDQWGFNTKGFDGRAMRISGVGENGRLDLTNNKYVCNNMPEEFIKITDNKGSVDMSSCYWNGDNATLEGFVFNGNGTAPVNSKVVCNGEWTINNYFANESMEEIAYVAKIGDTLYNSIQAAIQDAKDGDKIVVNAGTYAEAIVLDSKSITLEGTGNYETTLIGGITFKDEAYDGSNITIKNFNFEQNGIYCNIKGNLGAMDALTIEGNTFKNIPSHARVYALCIENTKNPISGLKIINNEFTFDDVEAYEEAVLGGINASVYGDAEITGNTFKNMPYNAILLYGVGNGSEHTIKVSNNTFENWGYNKKGFKGRAMRISGVGRYGRLDLTNNKYICENMPEEYIKITSNMGSVNMDGCYWNGEDATAEKFVFHGIGVTPKESKIICNGKWTLNNYFAIEEMKEIKHEAQIGDTIYSTIAAALRGAKDGDTVVIHTGIYGEPIVLDSKSITLEGTGNHETTLTGGIIFKDEAYDGSNITIRNLNIEQNGIYCNIEGNLGTTKSLTIEDNIFRNIPSHARVYAVCIENTKNPISGLKIVNNKFSFDDMETYKDCVAGGINVSVYGNAVITGNTFTNMPYNAILLYGIDNGNEHTVKVSGNTFEQWGFNTKGFDGRAMRVSGVGENGKLDLTNNKYICDNMPEEFIKITGNKGTVDMSKCYWNGEDATVEGFVYNGSGEASENSKVYCNGNVVLKNYFVADTMKEEELNTVIKVENNYPDITNSWAKNDIAYVIDLGIFNGTSESTFSPTEEMTRAAFTMVLGRLANADVSSYKKSSFSDVKLNAYYMGYVEWAVANKLVSGTGNGKFTPDQGISREQIAVILSNYVEQFGLEFPTTDEEVQFADSSKISAWAKDAVKNVQMAGIISGKPGNKFDPKGKATRAEIATIARRFVEIVIEKN